MSVADSESLILCIDDDTSALAIRQKVLEHHGYQIMSASEPERALAMFRDNPIDLVITDFLLDGYSGAQLVTELKAIRKQVPVLILTGLDEPPDGAELADGFITKGMPIPEFLCLVDEFLRTDESSAA
jgi:DNA-binding response OmpR family regulator